tara:strand:- start:10284 stop:11072 length:789 start_codon:yes stop_codon:yes gene_type:complete
MHLGDIVIGSSLEALFYAFAKQVTFISTRKDPPMFYRRLATPIFGFTVEPVAWSRLFFMMGMLGKLIDLADHGRIDVRSDGSLKIRKNGLTSEYTFDKCEIFEASDVDLDLIPEQVLEKGFLVLDDFELSSLGSRKASIKSVKSKNQFIREMHFYSSDRIAGANYVTDCVTESLLTQEQLNSFDYSDTMARFVIERALADQNVLGALNGYHKTGKVKYKKPKVKHVRRLVYEINNIRYADSKNIIFLKNSLKETINAAVTER